MSHCYKCGSKKNLKPRRNRKTNHRFHVCQNCSWRPTEKRGSKKERTWTKAPTPPLEKPLPQNTSYCDSCHTEGYVHKYPNRDLTTSLLCAACIVSKAEEDNSLPF